MLRITGISPRQLCVLASHLFRIYLAAIEPLLLETVVVGIDLKRRITVVRLRRIVNVLRPTGEHRVEIRLIEAISHARRVQIALVVFLWRKQCLESVGIV